MRNVVITGLGLVTPLGLSCAEVVAAVEAGQTAVAKPAGFDAEPFACRVCATVPEFDVASCVPDAKTLRLMNRDALLAVAAARRAIQDAGLIVGRHHSADRVGLFGATGLAGIPLEEVRPLIQHSADAAGQFDLQRFGQAALRRVRPVLTFKILANMPMCFVSIFESIRGENGIYTPWEGQGAQAIVAGIRAIQAGRADCALVGGCDVKTHLLGFLALQQHGLFRSWAEAGVGPVPAEGAIFLVLEEEHGARQREAKIYARIGGWGLCTARPGEPRADTYSRLLSPLRPAGAGAVVSAADGDPQIAGQESLALRKAGLDCSRSVWPKRSTGNLFAAAAALQVAVAAHIVQVGGSSTKVLANCLGYGSQQAAFVLEAA